MNWYSHTGEILKEASIRNSSRLYPHTIARSSKWKSQSLEEKFAGWLINWKTYIIIIKPALQASWPKNMTCMSIQSIAPVKTAELIFYFMVTNSAKRFFTWLFRDLSKSISKLVEHRAQSPVRVIQESGFSLKIVKFPQVIKILRRLTVERKLIFTAQRLAAVIVQFQRGCRIDFLQLLWFTVLRAPRFDIWGMR